MGRPFGDDTVVWVAPRAEIDEAIIKTNGNPRELETLLGLPENSLGDTPVRVNIDNIDGLDIRIPDVQLQVLILILFLLEAQVWYNRKSHL